MKKNLMAKIGILLVVSLMIGVFAPSEVQAAKAYGDSLKLNSNLKLNKKKTFTKTGVLNHGVFKKKKNVKVKYTVKTTRKSSGKNYKVTYKVNYKFLSNPKIDYKEMKVDDWYWGLIQPNVLYTVFDYQTGKSLEVDNDLGVKVKNGKWKEKYYSKQYFKDAVNGGKGWVSNRKTVSCSFTVTYPKDCKDVCVGIGFVNKDHFDDSNYDPSHINNQYWNGEVPYGKTTIYKKGKKTMSYMRLNK